MATWRILQCVDYLVGPESAGPFEGEARVIFVLHWECTDNRTVDDITYHARLYESHGLQPFTGGDFVAWEDVTEALALEWLHAKIGEQEVTRIEDQVTKQLDRQIHPTTAKGLPWAEGEA